MCLLLLRVDYMIDWKILIYKMINSDVLQSTFYSILIEYCIVLMVCIALVVFIIINLTTDFESFAETISLVLSVRVQIPLQLYKLYLSVIIVLSSLLHKEHMGYVT